MKGDAIISIIITIVNIVGGLVVGVNLGACDRGCRKRLHLGHRGDGLSVRYRRFYLHVTGIVVTRSLRREASHRSAQTASFHSGYHDMCGGILMIMCLVPGFPKLQFLLLAVILLGWETICTAGERRRRNPRCRRPRKRSWPRRAKNRKRPESAPGGAVELEFG